MRRRHISFLQTSTEKSSKTGFNIQKNLHGFRKNDFAIFSQSNSNWLELPIGLMLLLLLVRSRMISCCSIWRRTSRLSRKRSFMSLTMSAVVKGPPYSTGSIEGSKWSFSSSMSLRKWILFRSFLLSRFMKSWANVVAIDGKFTTKMAFWRKISVLLEPLVK